MDRKVKIYQAAQLIAENRGVWHNAIRQDPEYISRGGVIYPYDILGANLDPLFTLFEASGFIEEFEQGNVKTVCDIGCANGDMAFTFANAGYATTAVDWSYKHDQAPFVVSSIARTANFPLAVIDHSVDRHFSLEDIGGSIIYDESGVFPQNEKFDLIVCFGLLYHLRNPFAFLESLAGIGRNIALGTTLFTHLPGLRTRLAEDPVAYLVDPGELNSDPSNYWIFTASGFRRILQRCGFTITAFNTIPNNPLGLAVPDRVDLGMRGFAMLRSQ